MMKTLRYLGYVMAAFLAMASCTSDTESSVVKEQSLYPYFAVISDIHVGRPDSKEKIIKTLKLIQSGDKQLDAIFVVGDITDQSTENQYNGLIQLFDAHVPKSTPVYYMLGNHDQVWLDGDPEARYLSKLKQPLHQYVEIKGFPFITISVRSITPYLFYTQKEVDFLSAALEDASKKYPNSPIFVFAHVGVTNTVYGTGWNEGWGVSHLASVLEKYPQVVLFSGHSHFPIGDPRSIHQSKFTSVNLGSVAYSEIEAGFSEGEHPPGNDYVTEAVIVSVNKDMSVKLQRLDTYRNEAILPDWILWAPHNGTMFTYANRNGGSAPSFKNTDKPTISEIKTNSCKAIFPQATDNDVVHHYILKVVNSDGNIYKQMTLFSRFYLNSDMPESLDANITDLQPATKYTIKVIAVDSYKNKSTEITSAEFITNSI